MLTNESTGWMLMRNDENNEMVVVARHVGRMPLGWRLLRPFLLLFGLSAKEYPHAVFTGTADQLRGFIGGPEKPSFTAVEVAQLKHFCIYDPVGIWAGDLLSKDAKNTLCEKGLVYHCGDEETPSRSRYRLTELGKSIGRQMELLEDNS